MNKVYVVAAKRSAIGSFLGTLSNVNAVYLGSEVLKETLKSGNVHPENVDEVIIGNVLPAGNKQGLHRQIAVEAKIPYEVPSYSLNMICGSGMKAVLNGYTSIKSGFSDIVVAGGIEMMSNCPYLVNSNIRNGVKMGNFNLEDYILKDGLMDAFNNYHMGITAENIVEKYNISREEQDDFAYNSQLKGRNAFEKELFKDEIAPINVKLKKEEIIFKTDEYINFKTTREKIGALKPAFKKDGSVTAANSSGINDGASFLILTNENAIKKHNLKPLVEIVAINQAGVEPEFMGLGPIPAITGILKKAKLSLNDIDAIELNEAFAAQSLGVIKGLSEKLKIDVKEILNKTNLNGGAISLGHPLGASGNRIIVTLIHIMLKNNFKLGLASLCIGGGMGTSIILKKV